MVIKIDGLSKSFEGKKVLDNVSLVLTSGIYLLKGASGSGKTTFAIDLLHFLLYGKTTKVDTLAKVFNKHIPNATQVVVEGCITIDGEDYIIKRTITRPVLSKRSAKSKVAQKVEYYKIIGDTQTELEEYVDNQQEEKQGTDRRKRSRDDDRKRNDKRKGYS